MRYNFTINLIANDPNIAKAFERLEKADPDTQERWANTIIMTVNENGDDGYRAYVDRELAKAEADIAAGRVQPVSEAFAEIDVI